MLSQPVRFGAMILICLNLLMAFGSIWVFVRMAPAIEVIIDRNEVSLAACEEMLAALLRRDGSEANAALQREAFELALEQAKSNITEEGETSAIQAITKGYDGAFQGNRNQMDHTVLAIRQLGNLNRRAMERADSRAWQLGYAGAWGVVFMASLIFFVGILFLRSMRRHLLYPIREIELALGAFRGGDTLRRCSLSRPPKRINVVFDQINDLMDRCTAAQNPFDRNQSRDLP